MNNERHMDAERPMITECFSKTIMGLLENQETDVYLREHYVDSPNYFANDHSSLQGMLETMLWLTRSDIDKQEILDKELAEYMASAPTAKPVAIVISDPDYEGSSIKSTVLVDSEDATGSEQSDSLSDPGFP